MRLLVVGGTKFLGPAIVEAALGRGHQVTLFNRGLTDPNRFSGLETVHGDRREGGLAPLSGRRFDALIDVAGQVPKDVRPVLEALAGSVGLYVFVSTVSVYADHGIPQLEGQAVLAPQPGQDPGQAYGAGKAAAETLITETMGERAWVVRPGLIVGPGDRTDRFSYWPRRLARGGRVLAPRRDFPTQVIDVRDLGAFIVHGTETCLGGIDNVTGPTLPMEELVEACRSVLAEPSCVIEWTSDERLLAAGVSPWMGIPMWIGAQGWEGANHVVIDRALSRGLMCRSMAETAQATLAWDLGRGGPPDGAEGLSAERETELLTWLDQH